jgi:cytosine/adenosine deaminase-related metal-dependent hydrolase
LHVPSPKWARTRGGLCSPWMAPRPASSPMGAAIQMATINPATYYYMDEEVGGIAPGRLASARCE